MTVICKECGRPKINVNHAFCTGCGQQASLFPEDKDSSPAKEESVMAIEKRAGPGVDILLSGERYPQFLTGQVYDVFIALLNGYSYSEIDGLIISRPRNFELVSSFWVVTIVQTYHKRDVTVQLFERKLGKGAVLHLNIAFNDFWLICHKAIAEIANNEQN